MGELDSSLEDLICPISIQSKVINLGVVKGDYNLIMVAMAMVLHGMIDNFHSNNRPNLLNLIFYNDLEGKNNFLPRFHVVTMP